MTKAKQGISTDGREMHYSVGAVIEKNGKYLLIERNIFPLGFAGVAGHIDEHESPLTAVKREVVEESGFTVVKAELLFEEERQNNSCSKGISTHYWSVYQCAVSGEPHRNLRETKSLGWYTPEEIKKVNLEPIWKHWFQRLKIF